MPEIVGAQTGRGFTVDDLARRWRVSGDKIRTWITSGSLTAINTAAARCARPRYVITPEWVAEFEKQRLAADPPKTPRRRRGATEKDYFPD